MKPETKANKLREEMGIKVERTPLGRPSFSVTGVPVCTGGEFRALREVLRLSRSQFAAHFNLRNASAYDRFARVPTKETIYMSPAMAVEFIPALTRGRQLDLLSVDPRGSEELLRCAG